MKHTLRCWLIGMAWLASLASHTSGADCLPPPSGLVAWWRAEGNAGDAIGANHGALVNGTTFAPGQAGQAFAFDGTNNFLVVSNTASLDFGTNAFTIEGWLNFDSLVNDQAIIEKTVGIFPNSRTYLLEFDAPSIIRFLVRDTSTNQHDFYTTVSLPAGAWHHLAAVREGNTSRLFVNGRLAGQQTAGNNINTGTGGTAHVGRLVEASLRFFAGRIDELSLYNRALSASELAAIHAAGSAGKCPRACAPTPNGTVAWWRADGNANDSLGGHHGSLVNGAAFIPGLVGQAFQFDGLDDAVNVPNASPLDLRQALTLETWVRPFAYGAAGGANGVIAGRPFSYGLGLLADGRVRFAFPSGGPAVDKQVDSTSPIPFNAFTHVAATYDSAGGQIRIYLNGVLEGTTAIPNGSLIDSSIKPFQIGGYIDPGFTGGFFTGVIDEVSLYDRALSATEIAAIATAGSAGKCHYTVDWFKVAGGGGVVRGAHLLGGTFGQADAGGPHTNSQFSLVGGFWALPVAIQTAGAPTLTIVPAAPGQATISWTPNTPGFVLQETLSLSPTNWGNAPSGAANPVTVPAVLPTKFYRLFKP